MWLCKGLDHLGRKEKREEEQKQAMRSRKKFQRGKDGERSSLTERTRREAEDRKRKGVGAEERTRGGGSDEERGVYLLPLHPFTAKLHLQAVCTLTPRPHLSLTLLPSPVWLPRQSLHLNSSHIAAGWLNPVNIFLLII